MKEIDLSARSLGVNFNQAGEAHIVVWAPLLESVEIYLEKPRVMYPLMKDKYGYWELTTPELKPGDLYQFVLNDGRHVPDPASISQPYGVHGSSQALDLQSYPWTDQSWKNPQLEDYIFYELHVGTFSEEGTFAGIESKLDYLVDLGITAIELMPVAQFPGKRNWGYDGVYPFAVQDSYGGPEGLKHLVNACHEKGLAVVLDVVYNHMGPEGNYFSLYGPYFTKQYRTPWGDAINFDDEWSDGVRDYFIENTLMWFRDYHIDGLRLDAVHAIRDFSPVHILREIKQYVNDLSRETGRNHYLIVEMELNDNRFINSFDKGGYGMDAQWSDEFHHALRVSAGGERTGYYADMDGTAAFAKAYQNAYVHTGEYTFRRNKTFGTPTEHFGNHQFVVFSQNHDHIGNRMNHFQAQTLRLRLDSTAIQPHRHRSSLLPNTRSSHCSCTHVAKSLNAWHMSLAVLTKKTGWFCNRKSRVGVLSSGARHLRPGTPNSLIPSPTVSWKTGWSSRISQEYLTHAG